MISAIANQAISRICFRNRAPTLLVRYTSYAADSCVDPKDDSDMPNLNENPFVRETPKCFLCYHNIEPDYKNVRMLSQFQSQHTGAVYPATITGLCKYKQKRIEEEILKAQQAGLMGYVTKEPAYINDPKLFNSNQKIKKTVL